MGTVILDERTHQRIRLIANVLDVDETKAIALLVDRAEKPSVPAPDPADTVVPIHAIYKGQRIEAEYDRATRSITIRNGALEGESFTSPSRAAIKVVESIAPAVSPNRNGWGFWTVSETGDLLQSIRSA